MLLTDTLTAVAGVMAQADHDWWVIGSAAVALHGVGTSVADIDVVLAEEDAQRLLPALGIIPAPGAANTRFRSRLFARWTGAALRVEFMAGLHVHGEPLVPRTRRPVEAGGATRYVPECAELVAILRHFGRPKDLARAALLTPPAPSSAPSRSRIPA